MYHRGQNYYKKTLYKENVLEQFLFAKITKESLYKANSLARFLAKRDTPVAATLQRKSSGGIIFVIITKIITKENVPRNYFVIISARMVNRFCQFLLKFRRVTIRGANFLREALRGNLPLRGLRGVSPRVLRGLCGVLRGSAGFSEVFGGSDPMLPEGPTIKKIWSRSKFLISIEILDLARKFQSRRLDFPTKNRAAVGGSLENFILARNFQSRSKSRIFLIFGPSGLVTLGNCWSFTTTNMCAWFWNTEAHHCPGAVMVLAKPLDGAGVQHMHTGDFRATAALLRSIEDLGAEIASNFKSNPPASGNRRGSNDCDFSCDFYPRSGNFGCDFAGALRFQIAVISIKKV